MKDLKSDIKNKNFRRIYLFFGKENYLKKYYELELIKKLFKDDEHIINLDILEGKNIEAKSIIDSFNTLPFISEYRLIIVKDSSFFISGKKDDVDLLCKYISQIPSTSIVIFIESEVDKRNKLYKNIKNSGLALEFETPKENEIINWVVKIFKKNNKEISKDVASYFVKNITYNMEIIILEADKLINYKKDETEILKEDIDLICVKSLESNIFELVKCIGNKDLKNALIIYNNLIYMKEQPLAILSMISRQFRIILGCYELLERDFSVFEISENLNLKSFIVKDCIIQAKNFTKESLIRALEDCLKVDVNIKSGKMNDKLALEILIAKYAKP